MHQLNIKKSKYLQKKAREVRKEIIRISYQAQVGHIAPALSITDLLIVLYHEFLGITPKSIKSQKRNRFILSKGHAAAALYACLYQKGLLSKADLYTYCLDNGKIGVHPDYNPKLGIELTTGSLGHGLSVGIGMALGLRNDNRQSIIDHRQNKKTYDSRFKMHDSLPHIFVLVSDAELNEGSVWEGIMFAGQHKLNNLTLIIDNNGNQAFGKTKDVINLKPLSNKFRTFNWHPQLVNGHDVNSINKSLSLALTISDKPQAIIANTHAGQGVSFMKDKIQWHYWPLTEKLYKQALLDIDHK
jgi:transketolase